MSETSNPVTFRERLSLNTKTMYSVALGVMRTPREATDGGVASNVTMTVFDSVLGSDETDS